jgi:hypothetical protein
MPALSSADAVVAAIRQGREISCAAYILRPGRVLEALEAAASGGARVRVRLDGVSLGDDRGRLACNQAAVAALRSNGADAALSDPGGPPLHLKAVVADGTLFLDDRNWPGDGGDTILATSDEEEVAAVRSALAGGPPSAGPLATGKGKALALEAALIAAGPGDAIECESESFGPGRICAALRRRAEAGAHVRLVVAARDLRGGEGARERSALRDLQAAGVAIRLGGGGEKLALAGERAWVGSANATGGMPETIDWGLETSAPGLVAALHDRFERDWSAGRPFGGAAGEGAGGRAARAIAVQSAR